MQTHLKNTVLKFKIKTINIQKDVDIFIKYFLIVHEKTIAKLILSKFHARQLTKNKS